MPHFIMEYSANLDDDLDIPALFEKLNETAIATGVFPIGGIRTRAVRCEFFRVGEGDPENTFVHLTAKVGSGRSPEVLKAASDTIFETFSASLKPIFDRRWMSVGFEMIELHPERNYRMNNIHKKLADKA
ncbi:5-carboxymethyl-2-hydroxymuconate Delta-isomerase [Amphritea sp. 2_MG-2023]|uniref:5-carboxymethyl-2-hydroxymuconate Delta-isomerase n=1 Tax=Amphritea TaxID=515417 RepID=UPI001C074FEC|nr:MULTISPECIES: 5-carboxymethyl-2-hydroxymuconate Delta-isomerase [Amphritea]MBU2964572.1 5-carboxymethyl-2-hydroxymuconate Delta-isomerase [Amphritea atlantica]MDO6417901.1 5-carboxymethyl-2-hydroxymuconate Delta-isomerase [Amphritea sp. 2_MG-2023]MDX2424261.1 5-carboxymethyl-2-hydroxymuconate Delta-isomerase [Amphritea sp.]